MKTWKVPGAALAIVRDGDMVYLQGFGVCDRDGKQSVHAGPRSFPSPPAPRPSLRRRWPCLVDEGKMAWDDPVRKHVEFFHLADPLADTNVTLRDLLCHRTGLGRHDWLWDRSPWDRETLVRNRPPQADPLVPLGVQYQNLMYAAAGYAWGRAAKTSWEEVVRQRLFRAARA